jgi:4-hydroxyphenylpyruvate dioxygenase-like putative hemolysin
MSSLGEDGSRELAALRARLDQVDDQLLDLIVQRLELLTEISEHAPAIEGGESAQSGTEGLHAKVIAFAHEHGIEEDFLAGVFEQLSVDPPQIENNQLDHRNSEGGLTRTARRIDHVAIAVTDLEAAITHYCDRYGFTLLQRRTVEGQFSGMQSATLRAGAVTFVLCQGDSDASQTSRYIAHYGPGVQHVAIEISDHEMVIERLTKAGADMLTGMIRSPGLDQSFTRRDPVSGVQLEFVTRTMQDGDGFQEANVRELFAAMEREDAY